MIILRVAEYIRRLNAPGANPMSPVRWTADRMDQLERAARDGLRVALSRRGTEYIVVALRVTSIDQHEALVGKLPMTGEDLTFRLEEIDSFQVIE
jgi:uncharacterized protein with PhoU and TrkA domain